VSSEHTVRWAFFFALRRTGAMSCHRRFARVPIAGKNPLKTFCAAATMAAAMWSAVSCSGPPERSLPASGGPNVRVCLAEGVKSIVLGLQAGAVIETGAKRYTTADSAALVCSLNEAGGLDVRVGRMDLLTGETVRCFHHAAGRYFTLSGRRYPDTMLIVRDSRGFSLLNVVPMETYVLGVVPNEIGPDRSADELEAVKAQAILARTYALRKTESPLARLFDVHSDTRDQVYSGLATVSPVTSRAVRETTGLAAGYGGRYAECYYHSTCGGATEAVSLAWGRPQSKPYLTGIRDAGRHGDYCSKSPSYRWTETWSRRELEELLFTYLPSASDSLPFQASMKSGLHLLDLRVLKRMPSGRVAQLNIVLGNKTRHHVLTLGGDRIRWILRRPDGNRILRSSLFAVEVKRDENRWISSVTLRGAGSGHGIGLCQYGALDRARKGYNAAEILRAYFPGIDVVSAY